ncbi:MAG: FkbM family methyltransferase [Bacteroidetes bacterium]|nr:FkbM family methyltransferase [Bacteroidota bacterium]
MKESLSVRIFNKIDGALKFPNLRKGEVGIQVGFDLSSKKLITDVLKMHYRVKNSGMVIAIDPDPYNHRMLESVIEERKLNIQLVQKATFSDQTTGKLTLGTRASYNKIDSIQTNSSPIYTDEKIEVELDTLDNIVRDLKLDYSKIAHISITNNGAEYETIKGMEEIINHCNNLNLTIASGRTTKMGEKNGKRDYELILEFLSERGFKCKFFRINESFWWGVVNYLIIKRKWIFGKKRYGVIMASKGNRNLKFYQTFS